jgi:hypothetical protein
MARIIELEEVLLVGLVPVKVSLQMNCELCIIHYPCSSVETGEAGAVLQVVAVVTDAASTGYRISVDASSILALNAAVSLK